MQTEDFFLIPNVVPILDLLGVWAALLEPELVLEFALGELQQFSDWDFSIQGKGVGKP
jgi:hypothetical protein